MNHVPESEEFYAETYFPSLDGLRTLSIIPVVWHHSTPYPFSGVLGRGGIGVDLFFAISGFLITTLLIRERTRYGQIDLRAFFLRRSFRIFPLYYLVLALNIAYALWVRPDWEPSQRFLIRVPYYLTYTANWYRALEHSGPALFVFAWSLCTEEQFYAFWAPLLRYTKRLSIAALCMGTLIGFDLLFEFNPTLFSSNLPEIVRTILTSFACPIGLGALLSMAAHHPQYGQLLVKIASKWWAVPVVIVMTLSVVIYPWLPLLGLHGLFAILVLVCSARKRHALSSLLNHPAVAFVGRISYGIYLWHVAVIGGLKALFPFLSHSPGWLFLLALPLSIVVASLSYEFFEKPWLRFARRYKRPIRLPMSVLPSTVDGTS